MKEQLISFLNNNNININEKKLVLAVSTGIDSMALLHSFLSLRNDYSFEIIVAHLNHGKREQSFVEEEFITDFCKENNIKCYVKRLKFLKNDNFQAVAREARYQFFKEVLDKENSDYLVLAHHGDDLVETIIMRILRGSSLEGYSAIKEVSYFSEKIVLRPFLDLERKDIEEYQKKTNFKYFEDESNAHLDYTRNKIRHLLNENFRKIEPQMAKKFKEFSIELSNASKEIANIRDRFISEKVVVNKNGIFINRNDLSTLSSYMNREVLFEILKKYNLSKKNVLEIEKWIKSEKKNIKINYKGFIFLKEYDKISFINEDIVAINTEIEINGLGKYNVDDSIFVNVTEKKDNLVTNLSELWYNSQELPLYIRNRKAGDKIKLSGGYKKVKDLLIDEKIGISKRDKILLAVNKDGEVLMVFGVKKSEVLKNMKENDIVIKVEENYA